MAIADRVGVMRHGVLEQCAPPQEVYLNPANVRVAKFVGAMNLLPAELLAGNCVKIYGQVVDLRKDGSNSAPKDGAMALIRPEQLSLSHSDGSGVASATVINLTFLGPLTRISIRMNGDGNILFISMPSAQALQFPTASTVNIEVRASSILLDS